MKLIVLTFLLQRNKIEETVVNNFNEKRIKEYARIVFIFIRIILDIYFRKNIIISALFYIRNIQILS